MVHIMHPFGVGGRGFAKGVGGYVDIVTLTV